MARVELDIRAQIANLNKGLDKTQKELKDLGKQSDKTSKKMQSNMGKTNTAVTKLTGALGAMLTIGAAVQFTKAIIAVRTEFERFRAVLTNTLGSAEAANKEFAKIQQFASETPFSVRELTDGFVRLVNQGFKPTIKEMTLLGDLAASVGKDFIQLTEAIIDAQVGEFERLKEFGIKAKTEGDKITFLFKEQSTTVQKTSKDIQAYVLGLGKLQGVSGAMAAISLTLGGRISNLGDAWEALLDTLGGRSSGVFTGVIGGLSALISKINEMLEVADPIKAGLAAGGGIIKQLIEGDEGEINFDILISQIDRVTSELEAVKRVRDDIALGLLDPIGGEGGRTIEERLEGQDFLIKKLETMLEVLDEAREDAKDDGKINKERARTIADVGDEIKALQKVLIGTAVTDTAKRTAIELEIKARKDLIASLLKQEEVEEKINKKSNAEFLRALKETMDLEQEEADRFFQIALDETNAHLEAIEERKAADLDYHNSLIALMDAKVAAVEASDLREAESARRKALIEQDLVQARGDAVLAGLDLIAAIGKENAQLQQVVAISQAIINGALWITKIGAQAGVLAPPLQIAAALTTLAQIAIIRQQKFERGGYEVLSGRRHAQGGIPIAIGEGEDGEGHAVFSRRTTQKYGKFLPAFVKSIEEGKVDASDPNNFNFFYDDSRQVTELKDIKKILSKPEVRYEGKYRIETRNGQRTKVKI